MYLGPVWFLLCTSVGVAGFVCGIRVEERRHLELKTLISNIADQLVLIDRSRIRFLEYQPGVGPYGEPQLIRLLASRLSAKHRYQGRVTIQRAPDMLIKGFWGLEFKIVRPFGDDGKPAENWSVNLLHPYPGSTSLVGDSLKLCGLQIPERKAVVAIGYEHTPPQVALAPLIRSFELIAKGVHGIRLGPCVEVIKERLIHPVHQQLTVFAWEVLGLSRSKVK